MRLEAENISFQYDNGNRKILNNVSMGLEQEERVGITAPQRIWEDHILQDPGWI